MASPPENTDLPENIFPTCPVPRGPGTLPNLLEQVLRGGSPGRGTGQQGTTKPSSTSEDISPAG